MIDGAETVELSGREFKIATGPCLYGWKRGQSWLYIGQSSNGLKRIMDKRHQALGVHPIEDDDQIFIWHLPRAKNKHILLLIEEALIGYYKPLYNICHKDVNIPREEAKMFLGVVKTLERASKG